MKKLTLLVLGCALLVTASACASATDQSQMNVQSLISDARDGALLADQIVQGRVGAVFARAHAQELQDDVDQLKLNVTDERLPGHDTIRQAADQVSTALGDVVTEPDDPAVARRSERTLTEVAGHLSGSRP